MTGHCLRHIFSTVCPLPSATTRRPRYCEHHRARPGQPAWQSRRGRYREHHSRLGRSGLAHRRENAASGIGHIRCCRSGGEKCASRCEHFTGLGRHDERGGACRGRRAVRRTGLRRLDQAHSIKRFTPGRRAPSISALSDRRSANYSRSTCGDFTWRTG